MAEETTDIKETDQLELNTRAKQLIEETKLLNLARMANILIDLFGQEEAFKRVGEREGQEIEMAFPSLGGSFRFTLTSDRQKFNCRVGKPKSPKAIIIINVKKDNVIKTIGGIIKLPDSVVGLLRIVPKYLTRKIKIKGSLITAIKLCRCMMIGKNKAYKRGKGTVG